MFGHNGRIRTSSHEFHVIKNNAIATKNANMEILLINEDLEVVLGIHFEEPAFQRDRRLLAVDCGDGHGASGEEGNDRSMVVEYGDFPARGRDIERAHFPFELFSLEGRDGEKHGEFTVYR